MVRMKLPLCNKKTFDHNLESYKPVKADKRPNKGQAEKHI